MIVLSQWIVSQLLRGSLKIWVIKHFMAICRPSGLNTDYTSSEPLKTLVMFC